MRKRLLSALLALCMLLGLLPGTSFAADDTHPFTDVNDEDWFNNAVEYVYQNGLMNGTSSTTFSPYDSITRGQMVTILHRLDGTPTGTGASFTDVPDGEYYAQAVAWASANGIMGGYGGGLFGPSDPITREQLAATMFRYAQYKGYDTAAKGNVASFSDGGTVSSYAVEAVNWAIGCGLFTGVGNNMFAPADGSNRAQAATILMRFCESITSSGEGTTPAGKYYTVTFDYNYDSKGIYTTSTVENGKAVSSPTNPARSGYTFDGWYTAATGGSKFDFGTAVTANLTLYAYWTSASSGGGRGGSSGGSSGGGGGNTPPVNPPEDDDIYTNIEDYFDDVGVTILDTVTASTSTSVQTETEVKKSLEGRGFGQRQIDGYTIGYPITYNERMNGTFIDETEVKGDSDVKHPLYSTFYIANSDIENPILWTIYALNGGVFAYPASFSAQIDFDKEVIVTEEADGSIFSYYDGMYYNLSADGESVVTKTVETIDATTLDAIDFTALCYLTGTSRNELYDTKSVAGDTYVQASTVVTGTRAGQEVPEVPERYGEKFIAIALGDSYTNIQ